MVGGPDLTCKQLVCNKLGNSLPQLRQSHCVDFQYLQCTAMTSHNRDSTRSNSQLCCQQRDDGLVGAAFFGRCVYLDFQFVTQPLDASARGAGDDFYMNAHAAVIAHVLTIARIQNAAECMSR